MKIHAHFHGPPDSANGGYTCGILAAQVAAPAVEITLRAPPPLESELRLERHGEEVHLLDPETRLVAVARPSELELEVPPAPTREEAAEASRGYAGFQGHAFPTCFVCGPNRSPDQGLRIFAGPLPDGRGVAAVWTPPNWLGHGQVPAEFLWCALDCPGAFTVLGETRHPVVLGRMTGQILDSVAIGEACVVLGWLLGREGRKHYAGTALFGADGRLCAKARAVWIEVAMAEC